MKPLSIKKTLILFVLSGLFLACSDSTPDLSGGVTDIGNSVAYMGTVEISSGLPAANARVVAYYDNWNQNSILDSVETVSNENGKFELKVDSGKSFVLFASLNAESALALVSESLENLHIVLGNSKTLQGSIAHKTSGFMRIVGSNYKANIEKDGSFKFNNLPSGYISLVYVDENLTHSRLNFKTVDSNETIILPKLENLEQNHSWLTVSDYRYYANMPFGGIDMVVPEGLEIPQPASTVETIYIPVYKHPVKNLVVPLKVSISDFVSDDITVYDESFKSLDFEIDYKDKDSILLWVRLDSVSTGLSILNLTVVNKASEHGSAFEKDDKVVAALHMNGDAIISTIDGPTNDYIDTIGFFGKGITLKQGQFIDLGELDPFGENFTLSAWVLWEGDNDNHQILFSKRSYWSDSTSRFQWHYENTSNWFVAMKSNKNQDEVAWLANGKSTDEGGPMPAHQWTYVVLVNRNSRLFMYVNGTLVSNPEGIEFIPNELQQSVPFRIGGNEIATETWNGSIDEIRVETIARSDSWIKASFEAQFMAYYSYNAK